MLSLRSGTKWSHFRPKICYVWSKLAVVYDSRVVPDLISVIKKLLNVNNKKPEMKWYSLTSQRKSNITNENQTFEMVENKTKPDIGGKII